MKVAPRNHIRKLSKLSDSIDLATSPYTSNPVTPIKNPSFNTNFATEALGKTHSLINLPAMNNIRRGPKMKTISFKHKFNSMDETIPPGSAGLSFGKEIHKIEEKVKSFYSSDLAAKIQFQIEILEEIVKLPTGFPEFLKFILTTLNEVSFAVEKSKGKKKIEVLTKRVNTLTNDKNLLCEKLESLSVLNTTLNKQLEELENNDTKVKEMWGKCKESTQYKLLDEVRQKSQYIRDIKTELNYYRNREFKFFTMLKELREEEGIKTDEYIRKYNVLFNEEAMNKHFAKVNPVPPLLIGVKRQETFVDNSLY